MQWIFSEGKEAQTHPIILIDVEVASHPAHAVFVAPFLAQFNLTSHYSINLGKTKGVLKNGYGH